MSARPRLAILFSRAPITVAAVALAALAAGRFRWARAAAIGQVALILIGWGLAQSPYLVVPDLTVTGARTAGPTLTLLLWALAAGALLLFPSFAYLYRVFKQRPGRGAGAPRDRGSLLH
ncbi:MAG TPA: cytochrome d ubiquinol oxidase subunit II [Candidatus Binatia bacterium]|nr:cytochrome d ubiquinol oxidase subunit II [Candidatus Binatia bacterium]